MQREKWVSFREDQMIIDAMEKIAGDQGIDRSGFIRQTIREKIKVAADSRGE